MHISKMMTKRAVKLVEAAQMQDVEFFKAHPQRQYRLRWCEPIERAVFANPQYRRPCVVTWHTATMMHYAITDAPEQVTHPETIGEELAHQIFKRTCPQAEDYPQ
jgi:hypothetical protein